MSSLPVSVADKAAQSCLQLCSFVSWATIAAATCAVILDLMLLFSFDPLSPESTLHLFGIPLALGVILAERESTSLLRLCSFLESPLLKGLYNIFVGNLLLAFNLPRYHPQEFWRQSAGLVLVWSGVLYTVLGAACFRQLSMHQLGKLRRQQMLRQEMSSLSDQKKELERRLADSESKLELL